MLHLPKTAVDWLIRALPENLRYARSGQHYVVFIAAPDRMIVVDFLHVRMDLPARLAALGEGDSGE
ncbi:MAG: hypothetical protein V9G13_05905 [Marmoricola sp.]